MLTNRKTLHYYPSPKPDGKYSNPYSIYYREALSKYFKVVDTQLWKGCLLPAQLAWAALTKADVYIYNWIENFEYKHLKRIQFGLLLLGFRIVKWRKKKLVWMLHNLQPHSVAGGRYSQKIMSFLFCHSDVIIAHSKEAVQYAQQVAKGKVMYRCHPIIPQKKNVLIPDEPTEKYDILIWGTILPYKGIPEFLGYLTSTDTFFKILIVGYCKDENLKKSVMAYCNDHITFINERIDFTALNVLIKNSRYVLFPYFGDSVSSSGALIDTIAMGGNPVGPNRGAFKDLSEEGCCLVYNNYTDLMRILHSNHQIDQSTITTFMHNHSWNNFVESIINEL